MTTVCRNINSIGVTSGRSLFRPSGAPVDFLRLPRAHALGCILTSDA